MDRKNLTIVALAGLALGAAASATTFNEVEDNNNKAGSNLVSLLNGDVIQGLTTGSSTTVAGVGSADFFRVRVGAQGLGIYRNRLVLTTTGTAGHSGAIMGLPQSGLASDTTTAQTSSTATSPARMNQWYTFGREADIYYRVTGTASTTADYTATYSQDVVTATVIGQSMNAGAITFTTVGQGHTTDTEMFLYDANFNMLNANDDESAPSTAFQSRMTSTLTAGTYYLAVSNFNTAMSQANFPGDRSISGNRMDFIDTLANSSTTATAVNMSFAIIDSTDATYQFAASRTEAYGVLFYQFTVVPTPGAAALLGLAGLAGVRRRR